MATITTEIAAIRYDLRDENETQYSDAMLVDFYNRCVRALNSALASVRSDRVFSDTTLTITSGNNYVALPSDFASPISVEIDDNPLTKKDLRIVKRWQQETASGTPAYYAIHKANLVFERGVGSDTGCYLQYHEKATTLALGDSMPYSDEFNDSLKTAVIMVAKNRIERDITGDYALQSFFTNAAMGNVVRRSYNQKRNLGY
jgi:hypothetical protein